MFAKLGDITFELLTSPTSWEETYAMHYEQQEVLGKTESLQYAGTRLTEIEATVLFHASFCDPQQSIQALIDASKLPIAYALVMGNGTYKGNYVIERVQPTTQHADSDSTPISVEVQISLREYAGAAGTVPLKKPEDKPKEKATPKRVVSFSTGAKNPDTSTKGITRR